MRYSDMKNTSHGQINKEETDSWQRFERAVDAAVKSGPKHKTAPQSVNKKERPASKGRIHNGKTRS